VQLATDLGFLDEAPDQVGLVAVRLEQNLDGQVATEVRVASLENRRHAAAGDFPLQLEPTCPGAGGGHLRRTRSGQWPRAIVQLGIAQQDVRQSAKRLALTSNQQVDHGDDQ
jgi:hypothetical protein